MNYADAKAFLLNTSSFGSIMGLDSIRELLNRLRNPQNDLKFVHIAGTNGKGSVLAYLASILKEAGYTVGRYSSPPIHSYREVIQVNDEFIEKNAICKYIDQIKAAIHSMLADHLAHPTRFEIETALAFLYYKEKACNVVLLETGLGGLKDATNIVQTSILEIITSVSMDHMAILGNRLEDIACQKAGIIKDGTQVVSIHQDAVVESVLERACNDHHSELVFADPAKLHVLEHGIEKQVFSYRSSTGTVYEAVTITMGGTYQFHNAIIAVEAAETLQKLGFAISMKQLLNGLYHTRWSGRFTVVHCGPLAIIDGAHNEDAARQMAKCIERYFPNQRIIFLLGIYQDKEYEKMVELTAHLADKIITIHAPEMERLLPGNVLADVVKAYNPNVMRSESIEDAVRKAFAYAHKEDVIIAFGSLSWLGAAEKAICRSF